MSQWMDSTTKKQAAGREGGREGGRAGRRKDAKLPTVVGDEALHNLIGDVLEVFEDGVADLPGADADDGHAWGWWEGVSMSR